MPDRSVSPEPHHTLTTHHEEFQDMSHITYLLSLSRLVVHVCQTALAAVLSVEMAGHEATGSTRVGRALTTKTGDLSVLVDFVEFQHRKLDLLLLVLDLLRGGVVLLLALLCATTETEDKMESRLLLDIVVGEGSSILELLTSEDQTLLVGRDPFLILDFSLDILDSVTGLDLKGDGLTREGLDENLHRPFFPHQNAGGRHTRPRERGRRPRSMRI